MIYQKKRRKILLLGNNDKKNEDSTQTSDHVNSKQRESLLSISKKKSFKNIFIKRTQNKQISQRQPSLQKIYKFHTEPKQQQTRIGPPITINYIKHEKNSNQQINSQRDTDKQKLSNTNSTFSLQLNPGDQNAKSAPNKKKFKLYCQVKKKKISDKKIQFEKQSDKLMASSTASDSWIKNSIFSRASQKHGSNSTKKSQKKSSLSKKITFKGKIKQLKSRQKIQFSEENQDSSARKILNFQQKEEAVTKITDENSKISKKSQQKKHSSIQLQKQKVFSKLSINNEARYKKQKPLNESSVQVYNLKEDSVINQKISFIEVQNKILPEDSQIIGQSVKKLSEIKEQRNQDTISRSLKVNQTNSIDTSNSKNGDYTLHLSINSIHREIRRSYGCILETTELRESNLRKSIESSLSELEKSRQKINIEKFKQPKTLGQMGSQISYVQQRMTTVEKIEFHIELINTLSNFVYKSTELEYLMEDWDELNFLIYKKFYLQRMKVLNFLKKYPIKNPFCIKRASIQTKQVLKALRQNESEIKRIKSTLETQNGAIKKNLQVFYNQFSQEKHGQKINLFEYDNFSHWIYKQLWDQIQLFSYSQSHNRSQLQDRICKSLQAGFLISELNGNFVTPFEDAQIASHQNKQNIYIEDNLKIFQRYILNKKK